MRLQVHIKWFHKSFRLRKMEFCCIISTFGSKLIKSDDDGDSSHYFNNLTSLHSRLLCWKSLTMTHVLNLEDFFAQRSQRSGKRDEKECFSLIFSWCTDDWLPQLFCCGQIKLSSWLADVYLPRISLFHSILFWMFSMNLWLTCWFNCTWVSYRVNRNSTFSKLLGSFHVNGHWLFHLFLPSLHHDNKK